MAIRARQGQTKQRERGGGHQRCASIISSFKKGWMMGMGMSAINKEEERK